MIDGFVFLYRFFAKDPYGKKKDAENNKVSCNCRPQTCRANMHRHDGNRSYHTRLPRLLLEFDKAEDAGYDHHKTDHNADNHTGVVGFAGCGKLLALGYVCNVKGDLIAVHLTALGLSDFFGHLNGQSYLECLVHVIVETVVALRIHYRVEGVGGIEDTAVFLNIHRGEDVFM